MLSTVAIFLTSIVLLCDGLYFSLFFSCSSDCHNELQNFGTQEFRSQILCPKLLSARSFAKCKTILIAMLYLASCNRTSRMPLLLPNCQIFSKLVIGDVIFDGTVILRNLSFNGTNIYSIRTRIINMHHIMTCITESKHNFPCMHTLATAPFSHWSGTSGLVQSEPELVALKVEILHPLVYSCVT